MIGQPPPAPSIGMRAAWRSARTNGGTAAGSSTCQTRRPTPWPAAARCACRPDQSKLFNVLHDLVEVGRRCCAPPDVGPWGLAPRILGQRFRRA